MTKRWFLVFEKGNDGTLNGGATWGQGKHGSALSLNGADGYVRIDNHGELRRRPSDPLQI